MIDQSWIASQLTLMKMKPLTNEQKREYRLEIEAYTTRREEIRKSVSKFKGKISELETELQEIMPTTPNGLYIHLGTSGCGLKSVFPLGKDNDAKPIFYCMFCEQDFQIHGTEGPHRIDTRDHLYE